MFILFFSLHNINSVNLCVCIMRIMYKHGCYNPLGYWVAILGYSIYGIIVYVCS